MHDRPTFQTFYGNVGEIVASFLDHESPEYLVGVDQEEFLQYLIDKIAWEPLEWDEGGKTVEPFVARGKADDRFRGTHLGEEPRLRLRLPFRPHLARDEFLRHLPSVTHSGGEPEWVFEGDTLVLELRAEEPAVDEALDEVRFWIGGRNKEIQRENAMLRQRVEPLWRARRAKLEKDFGTLRRVTEALRIPLHQDPRAPKPVQVRFVQRAAVRPLVQPTPTPGPELDRASVIELVGFVETYSRQFEVTPSVYLKLQEEDLRDLVLGMLNVNYPGSSGETFSKKGKTDLFLRVEGGGSLIVECKRWNGPKHYADALDQLFRYLTWRHCYGILLTFCTTKDLTATIQAARSVMQNHQSTVPNSMEAEGESRFRSIHLHPQDRQRTVEVFHLLVDLAI